MRTYKHQLQPMYSDYHCNASLSELARMIIGDAILQMEADGISRQTLIEEKKGAWMVDKFRLELFKHIKYAVKMDIKVSERRERGVRIFYTVEVMDGETLMARAELTFFAVEYETRRILRLRDIEYLWNSPAQPSEKNMAKAAYHGEMSAVGTEHIRFSDCDSNHHLSSPKYLDYVCDVTDYWSENEKICDIIQVDFVSECRPNTELTLLKAEQDGMTYIRGCHADGSTAFDAMCKYHEL